MILRATVARIESEHELARVRNFELAGLVAFAFHEPKKLPKYSKTNSKSAVPDEVAQAQVRAFFIAMAGRTA
ncbi:hypothetical protein [Sulfitobacter sp. 20_GPM-1509m]|uniref:hypothetical protein n=1 Tax=Sulfitobacter sp. 20_GPM-1509m TaxID=1380367 RepID=UPI00048B5841|nr:hypothetical protein [Sulfitobacter sp. 20_GPM-1509m]